MRTVYAHQVSVSSCRAVVQHVSHRHGALTAAGTEQAGQQSFTKQGVVQNSSHCILRGSLTHARSNANGQVGKSSHDEAGNAGGGGCGCDERLLGGCLRAAVGPTSVGPILPRGFCRARLWLDGLPPGPLLCTLSQCQPHGCWCQISKTQHLPSLQLWVLPWSRAGPSRSSCSAARSCVQCMQAGKMVPSCLLTRQSA